jgi:hypothetical protein
LEIRRVGLPGKEHKQQKWEAIMQKALAPLGLRVTEIHNLGRHTAKLNK